MTFQKVVAATEWPKSVAILCELAHVRDSFTSAIKHAGFAIDPNSSVKLIVDAPVGYALDTIQRLDHSGLSVVITTTNVCPEYVEDLWDYNPHVLLADANLTLRLPEAMNCIERGERYRVTSGCSTRLTGSERQVLRRVTLGWSNRQIAEDLSVRPQTVANTLSNIFSKLHVDRREALILHYFGVWRRLWME